MRSFVGILGRFDINAIGRAGGGAQKTGDALFQAVFVALQHVDAAIALLKLGRRVRIVFGDGGIHHLAEGDAHALGDAALRIQTLQYNLEAISRSLLSQVSGPGT